jgi:hypothetical protein
MAGLVPAIHVFTRAKEKEDVDARHEAGHDVEKAELTPRHDTEAEPHFFVLPGSLTASKVWNSTL